MCIGPEASRNRVYLMTLTKVWLSVSVCIFWSEGGALKDE